MKLIDKLAKKIFLTKQKKVEIEKYVASLLPKDYFRIVRKHLLDDMKLDQEEFFRQKDFVEQIKNEVLKEIRFSQDRRALLGKAALGIGALGGAGMLASAFMSSEATALSGHRFDVVPPLIILGWGAAATDTQHYGGECYLYKVHFFAPNTTPASIRDGGIGGTIKISMEGNLYMRDTIPNYAYLPKNYWFSTPLKFATNIFFESDGGGNCSYFLLGTKADYAPSYTPLSKYANVSADQTLIDQPCMMTDFLSFYSTGGAGADIRDGLGGTIKFRSPATAATDGVLILNGLGELFKYYIYADHNTGNALTTVIGRDEYW